MPSDSDPANFTVGGARRIVEMTRRMEALEINVKTLQRMLTKRHAPWLPTIAFAQEDVAAGDTGTFYFGKGLPGEEVEDTTREVEVCNSTNDKILDGTKCVISWLMVEQSDGSSWHVVQILDSVIKLGKTDASHAKGATGTISVYSDSSTDTTVNVTATNLFADLDSGKWVVLALINGLWYLIAGEC